MGSAMGSTFVGRVSELGELRRGLADARAGRGRLFLLVGDAGIGKTRLADELASSTGDEARVLWGRCWESGGAPVYWPWVQALRSCVAGIDDGMLAAQLGHGAADVAQIVPEVRTRLSLPESPAPRDPEAARFQLFDSAATFLRNVAQKQPLVLILEDLHVADQPSLLLLQFLARELRSLPMLIIGTCRPVDRMYDPTVSDILSAIAREGRRLLISGLTRDDVAQYLDKVSGNDTQRETVDAVFAATEGNPLFLTEVSHLLSANGALAADVLRLPVALRSAIRQRIEPLPATAQEIMGIAAVVGREFEVSVLERVWKRRASTPAAGREALLAAIEAARVSGVVQPVPNSVARYIFAHVLVRDTLADDLPLPVRVAIHRQIGEVLEEMWAANLAPHLAEIAHHFVCAAPDGEIDKAVQYARRAGDRALALLAYEEAVQHYERAREVLSLRVGAPPPEDEILRCELLLSIGDAWWGVGDLTRMREYCQAAADNARAFAGAIGRPTAAAIVARAALGFGGRQARAHVVFDESVVLLLEQALELLSEADSPLRARVLARLAYALYLQPGSFARRDELSREAVAMARRCGDPATLRLVLNDRRWAVWTADTIEERLRIGDELVHLAESTGDREMALSEHAWRIVDLLERGDIAAVDAEFEIYTRIAAELQGPWYQWYQGRFRAMRAMLEGRFADGEREAKEALDSPKRSPQMDALLSYGTQLLNIRIQQGCIEETLEGVRNFIGQYPSVTIWKIVLPYLYAEIGREEDARLELERLDPNGVADLEYDYARLQRGAFMAETTSFLGDVKRARAVYDQLLPYEQRCVVIGYGIACYGSVAHYLGKLAATIGDLEAARRHFELGLRVNSRIRARPFIARTQFDYACLLLRLDEPDKASESIIAALATARELGMKRLVERIENVTNRDKRLREAAAVPAAAPIGAPTAARFSLKGEFWNINFGASAFQLRAILGLTYIAHLLRHPGTEFHVTDLVDVAEGGQATEGGASLPRDMATARSLGDAGEVLDAQAKAEYRRRLAELREELEEAQEMNDLGRIDRCREEIEALSDQLAGGIGLGGRHRRAGSHVERARVSVTKRIAIALKKIQEHDELLATYLRSRIKTGTLCRYEPDPGRPVVWDV
jgi:tetratricopeptide (TPR) repeat protein